jgi:DNA (cytosine-5)-methyltransferase 1
VPQTRKRAFLIASLDGAVALPAPTHRSYHPRRHKTPEAELGLPQWVSMAEALAWGREPAIVRNGQTHAGRKPGGDARSLDRPAFTLTSSGFPWWVEPLPRSASERRKNARAAERRMPADCRRHRERKESHPRASRPRAHLPCGSGRVRMTVEQASVLQGFRHDYPWQGSRTQRFHQIGNTVCPPVARCVLREAMRPSLGLPAARRRDGR